MEAEYAGNLDIPKLLLSHRPLMGSAREGNKDMVALLWSKGANINATTEETQETALKLTCCGGFSEVAEFLIKQGTNLELGASTPLIEAAQEGHTDLVRFLLQNKAKVQTKTQTGDTALTHAFKNDSTDPVVVLLSYGAKLKHESECAMLLIENGANVNGQVIMVLQRC